MASWTEGQLVTFECDNCGEEYAAAGEWKDVWESAKEDGWRAFKDGDDWQHKCPGCLNRR
jgi:hypothetical protein